AAGLGDDIVASAHQHAGRALHPRPGRAWVDLGDLPHELRHAGLLDREPFADGEGGSVQTDQGRYRGGPLGPTLDIGEDIPYELWRCVDLDTVFVKHVPNGTSCVGFCNALTR